MGVSCVLLKISTCAKQRSSSATAHRPTLPSAALSVSRSQPPATASCRFSSAQALYKDWFTSSSHWQKPAPIKKPLPLQQLQIQNIVLAKFQERYNLHNAGKPQAFFCERNPFTSCVGRGLGAFSKTHKDLRTQLAGSTLPVLRRHVLVPCSRQHFDRAQDLLLLLIQPRFAQP